MYKTQEGDPVYWLEKAEVMQRNKWEMVIAMEFSSGLKGSVKSEPFRVTTKASYKMKRNGLHQGGLCSFLFLGRVEARIYDTWNKQCSSQLHANLGSGEKEV